MVGKTQELALEKTEVIILCAPRKRDSVCFNIKDVIVKPAKKLKYFGVITDANHSFGSDVEYVTKKRSPFWEDLCLG